MDRKWWLRLALLAIVVAFIVLIGRAAMLAFAPEHKRLDRAEQRLLGNLPPPAPESAPAR